MARMPPRFMERMIRQSESVKTVFATEHDHQNPHSNDFLSSYPPSTLSSASSRRGSDVSSEYTTRKERAYLAQPQDYYPLQSPDAHDDVAIPPDALVLVTGANSFQGSHVVDQLLQHGYRVRGTVRDAVKAVWMNRFFRAKYGPGRFTTLVVPDMATDGAFDRAVRNCAGVVHVASVTSPSADPTKVITPSVCGALNVLEAAAAEPSVKRFVYTSCAAAAVASHRHDRTEVTSESWNTDDLQHAWAPPPYKPDRIRPVCASSKMQTESFIWARYLELDPGFVLNTVLPDTIWGPALSPLDQAEPRSVALLRDISDGHSISHPPGHFVDVQDSALLHVAALTFPDVSNQRLFAVAGAWSVRSVVRRIEEIYPHRNLSSHHHHHHDDLGRDLTLFRESGRSKKLLRRLGKFGWTDMDTSIARSLESCIERS